VNREYVDGSFNKTDWEVARQELLSNNYTSREAAYSALRKALERLNDPYTRFMDPKEYKALLEQISGELTGVGMRLGQDEETKVITVVEPLEKSPALKAGIQAGDKILVIDGKKTEGMAVSDAAEMIRGPENTKVTLRIARQGKGEFDVILTRAIIEVAAVRSSLKNEDGKKVGYIRLQEFSAHAGEQMEVAIKKLSDQKADAFVLDLRGNPGGSLRVSIDIARMWIDTGAIVRTVNRAGASDEAQANRSAITDKPLVVLVDDYSASASEILAGALKDNKRATVIGGQTFGKALVQSLHGLSDNSGLAVTIAHYYTPNGTDISKKGVTPDVKVQVTKEQKLTLANKPTLVATKDDPVYAQAIVLLRTTASSPRPVAGKEALVPKK
jgi:carboxyl-terminal processing protease